jgi:hypothetical protein
MNKHASAGKNAMLRGHCADNTVSFVLGQAIYMGMKIRYMSREFINCIYDNRICYFG